MEINLDEYGRIVIPKPVRDRLGLDAGTSLKLAVKQSEEGGEEVLLRPSGRQPALERVDGVFVHTGTSERQFDPVESVQRARSERTRAILRGGGWFRVRRPARKSAS
jgi:AbrB family looped-hinge helix DNA binding protein